MKSLWGNVWNSRNKTHVANATSYPIQVRVSDIKENMTSQQSSFKVGAGADKLSGKFGKP